MRRINSSNIKVHNRSLIIIMLLKEPISRIELAARTGLTRAAVSLIVHALIEEGMVRETTKLKSTNGRRATLLEIVKDRWYAGCIDISREDVVVGVADLCGSVLVKESRSLRDFESPDHVMADCIKTLKKMQKIIPEDGRLLGIGITTPGPVDPLQGMIIKPVRFSAWHGYNVRRPIQKSFNYPIAIENNELGRAFAENFYGFGRKSGSFAVLTSQYGIGCSAILQHRGYRPPNGISVGIGHSTIDTNGKRCECGNIGCLELYALPEVIVKHARQEDASITSWGILSERAAAGDSFCRGLIQKEARYLVSGLIGLVNLFALECIILSGDFCVNSGYLAACIETDVNERVMNKDRMRIHVQASSLNKDIRVLGAAGAMFNELLIDHEA